MGAPQAQPQPVGKGQQQPAPTPQPAPMGKPQAGTAPQGDLAMYAAMLADRTRRLPGIGGMVQRPPIFQGMPPMAPAQPLGTPLGTPIGAMPPQQQGFPLPPGFAAPAPTSPLFAFPEERFR